MTVYLIHFDRPLGNVDNHHGSAMHYIGYTDNLERRMEEHAEGRGAAIMRACWIAGIKWRVVRTWEGGRDLERQLKRRKKARCLCPICRLNGGGNDEREKCRNCS